MASAADSADRPRKRERTEWFAAVIVMIIAAGLGYWLLTSVWFEERVTPGQLGTDTPSQILGGGMCRPNCRSSFRRCKVSAGGFVYQQSRCQDTLRMCIEGCGGEKTAPTWGGLGG